MDAPLLIADEAEQRVFGMEADRALRRAVYAMIADCRAGRCRFAPETEHDPELLGEALARWVTPDTEVLFYSREHRDEGIRRFTAVWKWPPRMAFRTRSPVSLFLEAEAPESVETVASPTITSGVHMDVAIQELRPPPVARAYTLVKAELDEIDFAERMRRKREK